MPWWSGKSVKDSSRKNSKDNILDGVQQQPRVHPLLRRPKNIAEVDIGARVQRHSVDLVSSDPGSMFGGSSRSPSPSTPATRSPSFSDRKPEVQPLPLPIAPLTRTYSETAFTPSSGSNNFGLLHCASMPLATQELANPRLDVTEGEPGTSGGGSCNSSVSSLGSVEVLDSWHGGQARVSHLRPASEPDATDPFRPQSSPMLPGTAKQNPKNSKQELSRPTSPRPGGLTPSSSPSRGLSPTKRVLAPIQLEPLGHSHRFIQLNGIAGSAPGSSMSSPARSPRRVSNSEQTPHMFWAQRPDPAFPGSAQGSSPGSGHNSGHNSSGGDPSSQFLWNQGRRSPERSPIPSPRQRSPGPSSRAQSGTVSPLHSRACGMTPDSPTSWHEDGKSALHPLPLPPRMPSGGSPLASPALSPTSARASSGNGSLGSAPMRWQKGKLLGSGTFGNVYVGFNSDSGVFCAMKEVLIVSDDSKSKESVKQLGQEISLLSKLHHANIVQYIGTETLDDRLCIYLEYVSGGSIHKLLQEYGQFKEPVIRSFTRQILSGLAYLHNMHTVHRDIKGANILVDTKGKVKLADFGMAKHITAQSFPLSFKGSPYWMAPEVIKHTNGYDLAVDIWSLGCTVLEMATAKPPWSQYEGVAAMFKIGNSKELPIIPDSLSRDGKDFVRLCLQRNPTDRPTAQQLLDHPFVRNAPHDDRLEESEVLVSATAGIRSMNIAQTSTYRHDSDGPFSGSGHMSRSRSPFSPTSSDLSPRSALYMYGQSAGTSQSSSSQSRAVHHGYNGLASPTMSPMISSGCSTPLAGGYGNPPMLSSGIYGVPSGFQADTYSNTSRSNGNYGSSVAANGVYADPRTDFQWGAPLTHRTPDGKSRRRDLPAADNDILGMALGRVHQDGEEDPRQYHRNGNLVEHVSQQLLKKAQQPSPFLYRPTSPMLSRTSSELSH